MSTAPFSHRKRLVLSVLVVALVGLVGGWLFAPKPLHADCMNMECVFAQYTCAVHYGTWCELAPDGSHCATRNCSGKT